ncbi:MAG: hypothetical protein LBH58_02445, partial [Tannerellaceae bacterium]|nr:hypothetical protein [Tannerellaceae bacterium]
EMQNHYGYFKRTEGKDGDQIDVFVGLNPESDKIFVVDQVEPGTSDFDESKVMLGFNTIDEAREAYMSNYEEGWQGLSAITETNVDDFKTWLYDGAKQRKPFSEYKQFKDSTQDEQPDAENAPMSEYEYIMDGVRRYVEENALDAKEFEESEEYDAIFNKIADSYPEYIRSLSDSGELQRMYDMSNVGDEIKIRNAIETAGFDLGDLIDREKKKEQEKERREKRKEKSAFQKLKEGGHIRMQVDASEMKQIKEQSVAAGTFMKAPNGKDTNLNEHQWLQVRTKAFKNWFGDWENDPDNASKVVDENGEPLVVYHGTNREFTVFDKNAPMVHDSGFYGRGFYFTFGAWSPKSEAEYYGKNIIEGFVNVKNPYDISELSTYKGKRISNMYAEPMVFYYNIAKNFPELEGKIPFLTKGHWEDDKFVTDKELTFREFIDLVEQTAEKIKYYTVVDGGETYNESVYVTGKKLNYTDDKGSIHEYDEEIDLLRRIRSGSSKEETEATSIFTALEKLYGIDSKYQPEGIMTRNPIITEAIKSKGYDGIMQTKEGDELVVFNPNQIKSATNNNGNFNKESDDIRFHTEQSDASDAVESLIDRLKQTGLAKEVIADEKKMREYLEKHLGEEDAGRFLSLWHGSPHSFKKFSLNFIGSGEGAQSYGYGLYFTERKGIAEMYARNNEPDWSKENSAINKIAKDNVDSFGGDVKAAIEYMTSLLDESWSDKKRLKKAIKVLETGKELKTSSPNLYEVKIHGDKTVDDLNFVRWDKPVGAEIVDKVAGELSKRGFKELDLLLDQKNEGWRKFGRVVDNTNRRAAIRPDVKGSDLYYELSYFLDNGDQSASEFLLSIGIDGIQYPSEYQSKGTHEESYNYVVFDDAVIGIVDKIRLMATPKGEVYGFVTPEGVVYLDPGRMNLNTPVHEFGHLYWPFMPQEMRAVIIALLKQTPGWESLSDNPAYANLKTDDQKADELFNRLLGNYGEYNLRVREITGDNISLFSRIQHAINEFMTWLKATVFGDTESRLNMFAKKTLKELLDGKEIASSRSGNNDTAIRLMTNDEKKAAAQRFNKAKTTEEKYEAAFDVVKAIEDHFNPVAKTVILRDKGELEKIL